MSISRLLLSSLMALPAVAIVALPALAQSVDAAEATASSPKKPSKGERQALLWFGMLDANKDGRISREEAKVAFRLSPSIAEHFRDADLDGDGYLTQQEIRTVAERRRAERQERRQREAEQAAMAKHKATPQTSTQATGGTQAQRGSL